jgi:mRNA interferase RelE/StbE
MAWRIEFARSAERELAKLDRETAKRILTFLRDRVSPLEDPRAMGEALKGARLGGFWKYRIGDFRVIAAIEDGALRVLVVKIGNRRDVYR